MFAQCASRLAATRLGAADCPPALGWAGPRRPLPAVALPAGQTRAALLYGALELDAPEAPDGEEDDGGAAAAAREAAHAARQALLLPADLYPRGPSQRFAEHFHTLGLRVGGTDPHRDPRLRRSDLSAFVVEGRAHSLLRALCDSLPTGWGAWRTQCPVTFARANALVEGSADAAALYRGKVYLLRDAAARAAFLDAPARWLAAKPALPAGDGVVVCGPPPVTRFAEHFHTLEWGHRPSQALNSADRISAPLD